MFARCPRQGRRRPLAAVRLWGQGGGLRPSSCPLSYPLKTRCRPVSGRQRAEGEASARCFTKNEQPTGQRYVTKTARISYLYCVSYLYWYDLR
ncbi:hypothetical protein WP3S18E03_P50410 (plasmid) [Klebsiella quasipneumoniae]|nr:hypothetical protein WP3S18E03_P50410 [Klebsiella quasipneumoniae]